MSAILSREIAPLLPELHRLAQEIRDNSPQMAGEIVVDEQTGTVYWRPGDGTDYGIYAAGAAYPDYVIVKVMQDGRTHVHRPTPKEDASNAV